MTKQARLTLAALTLPLSFCFSNVNTSVDVDSIIARMTNEEKVDFIGGDDTFNIRALPDLGIPEIHMSDGPVGIRAHGDTEAYAAGIALAATWDRDLARSIGKSIGDEARTKNIHMMLGPAMNIYRMPLCGRNFEYLGEDPYLAGQIATAYVQGMQGEGVMACAKHFVANNSDFDRHNCSSDMDERTLHEIYLPAFKTAVHQGHVATVMTSYNPVNGVHASQNRTIITDILKNDWDFDGFVVSDWGSTYDGLECARNGLDVEMPSGENMSRATLLPALKNGELAQSILDDKIRRILTTYERFGFFEHPDLSKDFHLDKTAVKQAALDAARGSMVLLKNEVGTLPLDASKIHTIAVIGPNGDPAVTGGGGSAHVNVAHAVSLADAIRTIVGPNVTVIQEEAIHSDTALPKGIFGSGNFYHYKDGEKVPGFDVEVFDGTKPEGTPVMHITMDHVNESTDGKLWGWLPKQQFFSLRFTGCFSPEESGNYAFCVAGDDGYRMKIDDRLVMNEWRNQGEKPCLRDMQLEKGHDYPIVVDYYQDGGGAVIRIGAMKTEAGVSPEEYMQRALDAAKKADVVVMSVGFDPDTEGEGSDRTFEMPYEQDKLIRDVAALNPNIVVVLNSGGNVEMDSWLDSAKALLEAWYPGTDGNTAAAEILFGKVNPSGKLPASFERHLEDNPCYGSYFDDDGDKKVFYKEGIFMGYRYWDKSDATPRYPFGYGLSYTTFEFANLTTNKTVYKRGEPVVVQLDVKNTGNCDGAEVAQVYVGETGCPLPRPIKELKGFDKQFIRTGETTRISITLAPSAFSYYDPQQHAWTTDAGTFTIYVGASSADVREKTTITLE